MTRSTSTSIRDWISHLSLRRIVTSNRFIPEVDGFRFLAIFIVVVSHIYVQCSPPISGGLFAQLFFRAFRDGKHGVYLFFTISGFILALPFARHHLESSKTVNLRSYFKRRVTRLEPPYVLALLIRTPPLLFFKQNTLSVVGIHLLASLFYVHNLVFAQYSTINPPAWSLEIEIQFYILAPVLTTVFLIRPPILRRIVIIAAILLSGVAATLFIGPSGRLSLTLLNFFQYFAAGFLLCDLYLTKCHLFLPAFMWDVIGGGALMWILFSQNGWYPIILPFATICLYMAGFFGRIVHSLFSIPVISIIGGMCYSIYLTHSTVLTAVHGFLSRVSIASWPAMMQIGIIYFLCFAGILAVGVLYFILIERPCMDPNWPRRLYSFLLRCFAKFGKKVQVRG